MITQNSDNEKELINIEQQSRIAPLLKAFNFARFRLHYSL